MALVLHLTGDSGRATIERLMVAAGLSAGDEDGPRDAAGRRILVGSGQVRGWLGTLGIQA